MWIRTIWSVAMKSRVGGTKGLQINKVCLTGKTYTEALTFLPFPSTFPSMMALSDLLAQHESKTLEFKRDVSSPENIIRTVVAFSNCAGGTILIGVDDRTRSVRGLCDPTTMEERLANLISDRIEPRLVPEIQIRNPGL